jgi:hypothetical protein
VRSGRAGAPIAARPSALDKREQLAPSPQSSPRRPRDLGGEGTPRAPERGSLGRPGPAARFRRRSRPSRLKSGSA